MSDSNQYQEFLTNQIINMGAGVISPLTSHNSNLNTQKIWVHSEPESLSMHYDIKVETVTNGFILHFQALPPTTNAYSKDDAKKKHFDKVTYICKDPKELADRITACLIANKLDTH